MSARKRGLADFDDPEIDNSINDHEQKLETEILNSNSEQGQAEVISKSDPVPEVDSTEGVSKPDKEQNFLSVFQKKKKPTVEETHTRQTWLIRNDLIAALDALATDQDRGFKTQLVNYALEKVIDEVKRNSDTEQ